MKNFKFILLGAILFSFSVVNAQWIQDGPNIVGEAYYDLSGGSVSMSEDGTTVAIGSERNDAGFADSETGHVRIFRKISNVWTQLGSNIEGQYENGYFGKAVSISANGNIVAIGASHANNGDEVSVYEWSGTAWVQKGSNINSSGVTGDYGSAVDLSSDGLTLAVSASSNGSAGSVFIYQFSGGSWSLLGDRIDGTTSSERFGSSLSLSGDGTIIAVGAYDNNINGNSSGAARVYQYSGGSWDQRGGNLYGSQVDDYFGRAISISSDGNTLAVGAYGVDEGGTTAGQVRTFLFDGSNWAPLLPTINGNQYDMLGFSVSLSSDGNKLAIGAQISINGTGPGYVSIYKRINDNWEIEANHISGDNDEDTFGHCVSLNSDGQVLIASAWSSDTPEYNIGYSKILKAENTNGCQFAEYPFDNVSTTTTEDILGGNDAQVYGAPLATADRFNTSQAAVSFDGTDDFIVVPNGFNNLAGGSFSVWINITDTANLFPVFTKNLDSDMWADLEVEHGQVTFTIHNTGILVSSVRIGDNSWHHIVGTWHDSTMDLYVDGIHQANGSMPAGGISVSGGCDLVLGNNSDGSVYTNGVMDEFKIFECPIENMEVNEIYHNNDWDIIPFESECFNFNDNLVPENWAITHGDSAFVDNGKFMTLYTPNGGGEMIRMGAMPNNLDSVIIEWDAMVISTNPTHMTAIGLDLQDTVVFFAHMQTNDYDYGSVVLPDGEDYPAFVKTDSSLIVPGIYKNRLICTNTSMYFTAYKIINNNIVPFQFEINPFAFDTNYALENISKLILYQEASESAAYNWIDNVCIKLVERNPDDICKLATYKFNANVADNSGNGYHLSIENGPISFVPDRFGNAFKAVHLTDNNQELSTEGPIEKLLGDFTVSTWVKPDPLNGTDTCLIFSNYDGYGGEMMMLGILEASGKIFFGHVNNGDLLFTDTTDFAIPTEVWSHLVLTRDTLAKQYTLFFNGDSIRSYTYPVQPVYMGNGTAYAFSSTGSNFNYKGAIDGTRVWKCIITPDLVDSIYHIGNWPQVMCNDLTIAVTPHDAACEINNGTAEVSVTGGSEVYNISWSNGDIGLSASELEAGMHSVQVTDSIYGCMINQFFNIDNTGAPELMFTPVHNNCFGANIGSISTVITEGTAPYIIEWSNGETTADIENLTAGTYVITVVDANGCMISASELISEPPEITAVFQITNSSCGNADGEIIITPSGGMEDFTYNWENGTTDSINTGLLAGSYSVTVKDIFNCQNVFTTGFSDSGSPIAMIDSTISASCGDLGSLYISVNGGSGTYGYEWSNGETTEDLVGFTPGDYWLTVTDGNCMTMLNAEIPLIIPQTQEICVVTVDQNTTTNLVVWEKVQATGVDHYNIYREGFVEDEYELVGSVPYSDMSEFSDPVANPLTRSWKYEISAVDACGNESAFSEDHKTIHLNINLGLGGNINLIWDDYAGFDYTSFYINRHTTANGWEVLDQLPTYLHSYTDTPADLYGLWYSITVDAPGQCVPTSENKASGGPYYQASSNLEDEGAIDTKISTISDDYKISLFPNPNNGRFIVDFGQTISGTIQVIDVSGKSIISEKLQDNKRWINDSSIEKGVYLIKINIRNEGVQIVKMIVE